MRASHATANKTPIVSFPNGTPGSPMCGHQHETIRAAINCGGNAFKVIRKRDTGTTEVIVSYKRVSS